MIYLILGILMMLVIVFLIYPIQAVLISVGLIILAVVWKIYRAIVNAHDTKRLQTALQHRMAMEQSAEQRRNAKEARLQQAHYEKMRKQQP